MKILRLDSVGGISGDMMLGVLIGLGADREKLEGALQSIVPGEDFRLVCEDVCLNGLTGVRASVKIPREGHCHRALRDIEVLLQNSALPDVVKKDSIGVFRLLADAEGAVHGMAADEVMFHEVGALDSIVDIAGCCLAWHELGLDKLSLSGFPTGSGVVRTAHGLMPIPAPATAEIFTRHGLMTLPDDEPFELVTPTGAALAAYWPKADNPAGKVCGVVNAFGQRELLSRPNLLRGMVYDTGMAADSDRALLLECNLDDMTGELIGHVSEKLLSAGALDVWTAPVFMKKQRPGIVLSCLCRETDRELFLQMIFEETTTFGIREQRIFRTVLRRSFRTVETPYGTIRVKEGALEGRTVTRSPEWEDCRAAAEKNGVPAKDVYRAAQK
ncbi:MAG: nickel pincer cofactor biosynthesis protein LarC [Lentisphaeria bacterium]|nr:nickel pincer cofactor biosynthesis protein LarC [Lentisphaeria bacterium]